MEILISLPQDRPRIKMALFDFDGTISTLRYGWESIMEPLMLDMITGGRPADHSLVNEVRDYIDSSTGIQTIYQMQWLAEAVKRYGWNKDVPDDPWWFKEEYNSRLMQLADIRKKELSEGSKSPEEFLMKGSKTFLEALVNKGVSIYVASGTDDPDVKKEADVLGLSKYFIEIAGAPPGKADCSKEAVLKRLVQGSSLKGPELVVIGDGKVEIVLGREAGALTVGLASDEEKRSGVNETKRQRLIKAGAHVITGDFCDLEEILDWLRLN